MQSTAGMKLDSIAALRGPQAATGRNADGSVATELSNAGGPIGVASAGVQPANVEEFNRTQI